MEVRNIPLYCKKHDANNRIPKLKDIIFIVCFYNEIDLNIAKYYAFEIFYYYCCVKSRLSVMWFHCLNLKLRYRETQSWHKHCVFEVNGGVYSVLTQKHSVKPIKITDEQLVRVLVKAVFPFHQFYMCHDNDSIVENVPLTWTLCYTY